jgi:hypothetical protein
MFIVVSTMQQWVPFARLCNRLWCNSVFPTLCHKQHDFPRGGDVIEYKMHGLIFCIIFVTKISHSENNPARHCTCASVFLYNTRYSCQTLMKREFSLQIFGEKRRYPILWRSIPVVAELFHANTQTTNGRTDKYDEANSRFSQFIERALIPTSYCWIGKIIAV